MTVDKNINIFVLDTNVLLHDPNCIFEFEDNVVYIPLVVLEELDNHKKGNADIAMNARQVHRYFDALISNLELDDLKNNNVIIHNKTSGDCADNKIIFQCEEADAKALPSKATNDDHIINSAKMVIEAFPDNKVTLVTKDLNMRIRAAVKSVPSEDYLSDMARSVHDDDIISKGMHSFNWEDEGITHIDTKRSGNKGRSIYSLEFEKDMRWFPGMYVHTTDHSLNTIVRKYDGKSAVIESLTDHYSNGATVYGLKALNQEQNFAFNALMDPEIDLVTLLGGAGTGKTLVALAAALEQVIESKKYTRVICTRATIPVGEDIGFLPGDEGEKMGPWMGAITDNLDFLLGNDGKNKEEIEMTEGFLNGKVQIKSTSFMRGRSFKDTFLILDETQNLTPFQIKTFITRAGTNCKVVCLGNLGQIDTPYLTEYASGLAYLVEQMKDWEHAAHITLQKVHRGRLAEHADKVL